MNKSMEIRKHTYVLFFVNLAILFTLILFKMYFTTKGYHYLIVNVMLIINIIILLFGIFIDVLFLRKPDRYDENKMTVIVLTCFCIYILINTLGVYLINKPFDEGYTKISTTLSEYCDTFGCDRYETVKEGIYEDFIIKNTYFDYNNVENNIEIHTKYSSKQVVSVSSTIYSENELFSETLIREQLKNYFINFDYDISEEKIREAFNSRFTGSVKDGKATYKVSEIYDDEQLEKIKTEITLNLK